MKEMYSFCIGSFPAGVVSLTLMAFVGVDLTFQHPAVIWTIGSGVGLIAGALGKSNT